MNKCINYNYNGSNPYIIISGDITEFKLNSIKHQASNKGLKIKNIKLAPVIKVPNLIPVMYIDEMINECKNKTLDKYVVILENWLSDLKIVEGIIDITKYIDQTYTISKLSYNIREQLQNQSMYIDQIEYTFDSKILMTLKSININKNESKINEIIWDLLIKGSSSYSSTNLSPDELNILKITIPKYDELCLWSDPPQYKLVYGIERRIIKKVVHKVTLNEN